MPSLVKKLISSFNPPDIRKFYKIHREIVHFMVRSAVKVNDGHFDKYVTAPDGHNIRVRIYPPRTIGNSTRLLVFYHGGGWVIDDIDRYHKVCRQLAEMTGSYVLSVDYRLAPEHKYPAGLDDCYEVTRLVFANAARYGIKKRNTIVIRSVCVMGMFHHSYRRQRRRKPRRCRFSQSKRQARVPCKASDTYLSRHSL